ncbi:hypothetical protein XI03_07575 [Bradyrhizobium sp. CCBAU 65884]|nr:hypothetical protein [Bradyrhizobium sp. CCBAU 65884]
MRFVYAVTLGKTEAAGEEASMAAVAPHEGERFEQRRALLEDRAVVPAGLLADRESNPALSDAARIDDEQVLMPVDPPTGSEPLEKQPVEPARPTKHELVGLIATLIRFARNPTPTSSECADNRLTSPVEFFW